MISIFFIWGRLLDLVQKIDDLNKFHIDVTEKNDDINEFHIDLIDKNVENTDLVDKNGDKNFQIFHGESFHVFKSEFETEGIVDNDNDNCIDKDKIIYFSLFFLNTEQFFLPGSSPPTVL